MRKKTFAKFSGLSRKVDDLMNNNENIFLAYRKTVGRNRFEAAKRMELSFCSLIFYFLVHREDSVKRNERNFLSGSVCNPEISLFRS